jgi:phage repressor protein C with HTH and peptisase S24 domain
MFGTLNAGGRPHLSTGNSPRDEFFSVRDNARAMADTETVADRVDRKLKEHKLTPRAASLKATGGKDQDLVRDIKRRGRAPKGDGMAKLAGILGTTQEWLLYGGDERDSDRPAQQSIVRTEVTGGEAYVGPDPYAPEPPAVPLYGSAIGGEYGDIDEHVELTELHLGEVLQWLKRPGELVADPLAYTLTVVGDSMSPLFEPGVRVNVSPRASVGIGDNVIVQLRGRNHEEDDRVKMVLIKRLVRRSASFVELKQFNPDITFQVPIVRIYVDQRGRAAIHKVVSATF